jgi:uncharacterized protein YfaS (alpha-2-macroglobulin family)
MWPLKQLLLSVNVIYAATAVVLAQVTDALTGKPAVDAEVTVVVVDEAILALLPYPLPVSCMLFCSIG